MDSSTADVCQKMRTLVMIELFFSLLCECKNFRSIAQKMAELGPFEVSNIGNLHYINDNTRESSSKSNDVDLAN